MSLVGTIPSRHFAMVLSANVNNKNLSDEAFRELVRNTILYVEGGKQYTTETGRKFVSEDEARQNEKL